jgi:predicted metal-binding protein
MSRKYKWNIVQSNITYKISDIVRLFKAFKLHAQTIRKWIKSEALEAFEFEGEFYIYGEVLKAFLKGRVNKNKTSMKFTEFRCGKCKNISPPLNNKILEIQEGKGGSILLFGTCKACRHKMSRPYKKELYKELEEKLEVIIEEKTPIYNTSASTCKTHIKNDLQLALSERIKNKEKPKQLSLF